MKLGITTDWHWSQFSSIIRSMGSKYSVRLEHLIDSLNWAEELFEYNNCYAHICLGDAFDKAELNAQEISALKEVKWGDMSHFFLVGNHEMASSDLSSNTANIFSLLPGSEVFDKPKMIVLDGVSILMLPYILNCDRPTISSIIDRCCPEHPQIIFSHNDIAGIQLGGFVSQEGFSLDEIKETKALFLNGHLHNGGWLGDHIYNVGNLCGQNFSEDAFLYKHTAWILDTEAGKIERYENPYSFRFYKLDFTERNDIDYINDISSKVHKNAVVTVKCLEKDLHYLKARFGTENDDLIPRNCNVLFSRFVVDYTKTDSDEPTEISLSVDHLAQFEKYVKETIGADNVILSELQEVLK